MGHKADNSFFNQKRPWSKRKDNILQCYLTPYLYKIATQRAPILIVDAFAGPGKFGDGESGSPLIICKCVDQALSKGFPVPVSVMCIEPDPELFSELHDSIKPFPFAEAKKGEFHDYIHDIEKLAGSNSVFMYIDPWTVEGLQWAQMEQIFKHLFVSKMSIEVLLNFNAQSLARRGLAALKLAVPNSDPAIEDQEEIDAPIATSPSVINLNNVVGGEWWQPILVSPLTFPQKVQQLADGICTHLSVRFKEVCQHPMKAMPHHLVPKYFLIFGSRHRDALLLMNDEMVKSQRSLADLAKPKDPTLFEMRPTDLVPDMEQLPEIILAHTQNPMKRGDVILNVVRENFCKFAVKDIRSSIGDMLRKGTLKSETGKTRINDDIKIFRPK
ncbi:MAG: three-Cys-motif partner protein TcmP [Sedimentisphaerales bacterium]